MSAEFIRGVGGRGLASFTHPHHAADISTGKRKLSVAIARKILTDRSGDWPWLHQYPAGGDHASTLAGMTIDSLIAVSQDRVLHTCRGGRVPGSWQSVGL